MRPKVDVYTELHPRVWIVDGHSAEAIAERVGPDAEALDSDEFRRRLDGGDRPDALLVDAETLSSMDGQRFALDGILRLLVAADATDDVPAGLLGRPSVRVVPRVFSDDALDRAIRWLTGVDDDAVSDAELRP